MCGDYTVFATLKRTFIWHRVKNVIKHIPFVQPVINFYHILKIGQLKEGQVEAEKLMLKIGEEGKKTFLREGNGQVS